MTVYDSIALLALSQHEQHEVVADTIRMRRIPKNAQGADGRATSPSNSNSSSNTASNTSVMASAPQSTPTAFSYSSIAANHQAKADPGWNTSFGGSNSDSTGGDQLNPFKYSLEYMLSFYKPSVALPLEFERHDYVTSEENLEPVAHSGMTELEKKVGCRTISEPFAQSFTGIVWINQQRGHPPEYFDWRAWRTRCRFT